MNDFLDPSKDTNKFEFKVIFKGNLKFLPKKIVENLIKLEKNNINRKKTLVIYLNYSGQDDILNASKSLSLMKIFSKKNYQEQLSSSGIPDPDILIRTGGYQRLSNFIMFNLTYTELFFTNTLWPDFSKKELQNIIDNFLKIKRKYGL